MEGYQCILNWENTRVINRRKRGERDWEWVAERERASSVDVLNTNGSDWLNWTQSWHLWRNLCQGRTHQQKSTPPSATAHLQNLKTSRTTCIQDEFRAHVWNKERSLRNLEMFLKRQTTRRQWSELGCHHSWLTPEKVWDRRTRRTKSIRSIRSSAACIGIQRHDDQNVEVEAG